MIYAQCNELFRTSIKDIPDFIRPAEFVPETLKINHLFKKMQLNKSHMVIVVDEYGQTSGVVAMEDILEEIVGNIEDEHDQEEALIHRDADGSYRMDGLANMKEVIARLHLPVKEDEFDTLNGFLTSILGKVPADHDTKTIQIYGFDFSIQKVADNMIREVVVYPSK